jgi:hypothetical protein
MSSGCTLLPHQTLLSSSHTRAGLRVIRFQHVKSTVEYDVGTILGLRHELSQASKSQRILKVSRQSAGRSLTTGHLMKRPVGQSACPKERTAFASDDYAGSSVRI